MRLDELKWVPHKDNSILHPYWEVSFVPHPMGVLNVYRRLRGDENHPSGNYMIARNGSYIPAPNEGQLPRSLDPLTAQAILFELTKQEMPDAA